ncbi:MAG: hypothetical protein P8J91_17515 [Pirellulaceae bacterium]|nr:hypothetical protein [Pirellulaceae bacterium]MDG2105554.1 hypothetical protein [Pirellulaceae bacterium]
MNSLKKTDRLVKKTTSLDSSYTLAAAPQAVTTLDTFLRNTNLPDIAGTDSLDRSSDRAPVGSLKTQFVNCEKWVFHGLELGQKVSPVKNSPPRTWTLQSQGGNSEKR